MMLQSQGGNRESPQWIAVYITHNLQEAHIVFGKLQANDVPAMIHQEAGATALGITLGNLGEIKILVAPADFNRAGALLYPDVNDEIEANNDNIHLSWLDDGDGVEYYLDDDEE